MKPQPIAGLVIWALCLGGGGVLALIGAELGRSSYDPELGATDLFAYLLFLASAVFGAIATWRLAVAIDWLVGHRRAAPPTTWEPRNTYQG